VDRGLRHDRWDTSARYPERVVHLQYPKPVAVFRFETTRVCPEAMELDGQQRLWIGVTWLVFEGVTSTSVA
jgi:hypothetical protein